MVKYNSSGTKQWTKQLGTSSNDGANGVATDSSGNVYVTGSTYRSLDGNTSAGNADLFVVKYNSSGTKQWTKQLGSSSDDYANDVVTDSSGNAYLKLYSLFATGTAFFALFALRRRERRQFLNEGNYFSLFQGGERQQQMEGTETSYLMVRNEAPTKEENLPSPSGVDGKYIAGKQTSYGSVI